MLNMSTADTGRRDTQETVRKDRKRLRTGKRQILFSVWILKQIRVRL